MDAQKVTYQQVTSAYMTVQAFVDNCKRGLPTKTTPLTVAEFFDYLDENDNNLNRIWMQYDKEEQQKYKSDYDSKNLPYIKSGTTLLLPATKIELEFQKLASQGQFLSQGDFKIYWADAYSKLISSMNFVPEDNDLKAEDPGYFLKTISLSVRVWIYVRALDKIVDVSPFVIGMTTNKSALNGTFDIQLAPTKELEGALGYGNGFFENYTVTDAEGSLVKGLLEKYVGMNDMVFLRFEKLKLEKEAITRDSSNLEVDSNNLVNNDSNYNVWDMIGFVDICNVIYSSIMNDSIINISGRDFTKLLNEDGSYFMPLKWVEGSKDRWFYGGDEADAWYQRNVVTGNYDFFFNYGFRRIRETVWFVINLLSNIGVVKDDLFAAYGDRRTQAYTIEDDQGVSKTQQVKGIWQIVKVFVEDSLNDRSIVDPSFANPDGTLMSFILKICQEPFVEVLYDTYVDTLDIVVRQPPFTEKAITDVVTSEQYITINSGNLLESSLAYDDRVYSWYQLFPQNNFIGTREFTSLAFVPIIYFDEIVKVYGNKKQQIQDMYLSLSALDGAGGTGQLNSMAAAMLNDLLFVIETSIYLPFTRRGTITINGDRRIKTGTFVLNEASNELFYVTGVTQNMVFSNNGMNRTTTLQVERGMFFPILSGNDNEGKYNLSAGGENASYFKIAELKKIKEDIVKAEQAAGKDDNRVSGGGTSINKAQFEYFLNRKMYK